MTRPVRLRAVPAKPLAGWRGVALSGLSVMIAITLSLVVVKRQFLFLEISLLLLIGGGIVVLLGTAGKSKGPWSQEAPPWSPQPPVAEESHLDFETEVKRLRLKVWRKPSKSKQDSALGMFLLSAAFLTLDYYQHFIVYEILSLVTFVLAILFIYSSNDAMMKRATANAFLISMLHPFSDSLKNAPEDSTAVFYTQGDQVTVTLKPKGFRVFKPGDWEVFGNENSNGSIVDREFFSSYGSVLTRLLKNETHALGGSSTIEAIPKVIVNSLQLARNAKLSQDGESVTLVLSGYAYRQVYEVDETKNLCAVVGCPVASSIAEIISGESMRPVQYMGYSLDPRADTLTLRYKLC